MLNRESDIKPIAYGAMVVEGFVAVTALVAACVLQPGDYFAINVAQDKPAQKAAYVKMVAAQAGTVGNLTPEGIAPSWKGKRARNWRGEWAGR